LELNLSFNKKDILKDLLVKPGINFLLQNAFIDWTLIVAFWLMYVYTSPWEYPIVAL
jgi:hypothetical protein